MLNSLGSLLAYGISGLGLALAILSYRLLTKEQAVQEPRPNILRAIYIYMAFSLILVGAGLFSEFFKPKEIPVLSLTASKEAWLDVVAATKARLVGNAPRQEYMSGDLKSGQSQNLPMRILPGECKFYFVMAKPPAEIEITASSVSSITVSPQGKEPHLAFGRICSSKTPTYGTTEFMVTMTKGDGPFIAETYGQP
jgi:hypothetical protein